MDQKILKQIIETGIMAPSADNVQPWKFVVRADTISVILLKNRDTFNWNQRASYIALGALLETMNITASTLGYRSKITIHDLTPENEVYLLAFEPVSVAEHPLYKAIEHRCTNRKPYHKTPLTETEIKYLQEASENNGIRFVLTTNKVKCKVLGKSGGEHLKILFSNKRLHDYFFSHVRWTKEEDNKNSMGFYIKTLELPKPIQELFKIIRHWYMLSLFNIIGFSSLVALGNGKMFADSPGFGALIIKDTSPKTYLKVGKFLQRIWLSATNKDLSLQPLTGILFMHLKITNGETEGFSTQEISQIKKSYLDVKHALGAEPDETVALLFRIGHADPPTAHSSRLKPEILFV